MKDKNEFYLIALSVLLASSLLKSTEVFQLGGQLKEVLFPTVVGHAQPPHITIKAVGVYLFMACFILFFAFSGFTVSGIVLQMQRAGNPQTPVERKDLGWLVIAAVWLLIGSHIIAFFILASDLTP